ncbi:MAG: hypothetical protein UV60_C0006G0044 [Parcubacteria group bacterium GW2011_GWA2_43_11]|nr:MAG: hypothetical protein UU89_C0005G0001 [Parcubacteria group bacterium GW2011_GWC2_42_11]KKS85692.1 MAG: hypothetical protein UV60_C0006G0044 [Parcubacteria group bacterium GW2011_GWA2_43_11]
MVGRLDFVCFALPFQDPPAGGKKQSTLVEHFIEFFLNAGSIPAISTKTPPLRAVFWWRWSNVPMHVTWGIERRKHVLKHS